MSTTTHNTTGATAPGRSRRLVLAAAVSVAAISTVGAYLAMVSFGVDVLAMSPATAYATAGVFELSLVTVALLAREAARDNRPSGVLLSLTWGLSSASGVFAAWHELYMGHPAGAALFRFLVPLLAALMWHLALIGDRHLATGTSWSAMRATARMHALFLTTEDAARAHHDADTSTAARRAVARAEARRRKARAVALRTVPPDEMRARAAAHLDALSAVADAVSDVAATHAATNHRVSGLSVSGLSGPVLSAPDSGEAAGRTLAATLADNRADNGTDTAPDSREDGVRLSAVSAAGHPDNTPRVRATVRPDNHPDNRAVSGHVSAPVSGPVSTDKAARLAVVSALLSDHPDATTRDALSALAEHGHTVTDRTARRLLADARTDAHDDGADSLAAGA